ncbi:ABC transporter ATP-binding protein [Puia sp.]|jgi:ABC-2 type transport system ATP-binding protein|uniref:ABC transporter ATP-binding protein n=1 Tax=Puia sp. TaxID=2045100 RepID=UPI002F4125AE
MLEFRQVEKRFDDRLIVSIPDQTLDSGIYWLQGANGTGKTTLLRMIAGILPFRGDILLQGCSQRNNPVDYRRIVGWADAEPLYPGFLTGDDLLNFYGGILRPEPRQIAGLTQHFGVRGWLNTRVATWSSGMTKKFALLLAFLGRPALVTLDEPLITLDEPGLTGLTALIREYHREYGTGFLLSSHQPVPAEAFPAVRPLTFEDHSIKVEMNVVLN